MNHKIFAIWIMLFLKALFLYDAYAYDEGPDTYLLEPVFVYSNLIDEYYHDALRNIECLDTGDIPQEQFLTDKLKGVSFLDVQRRGPFSVQSDVQIRGASFEQTDVLIDGIKVNDPQTGHFNLDIPFFLEDIDKIIIVAGPTASLNGSGRQGGSIHIQTKRPATEQVKAKVVFGDYDFSSQSISTTYFLDEVAMRTTLNRSSAGDYRPNTDFDNKGISHIAFWESSLGQMQFNFGMLDKDFGANGFYSEFFPLQAEATTTTFSSLSLKKEWSEMHINPQMYIRRHKDRFVLNKSNPALYENRHTNYVKGAKIDVIKDFDPGELLLGFDTAQDSISSTSLGSHKRLRNTLYNSFHKKIEDFDLMLGLSGYFYESFEDYVTPEIGLGYWVSDNTKLRSAFNQSYRIPTFTELYYVSPANMGNVNLVAEKSNNYELGADYTEGMVALKLTFFRRDGKNLIDWVREPASTVYQVRNVAKVTTNGIEADIEIYPDICGPYFNKWEKIFFGYSYIDRDEKDHGLVSKYVFDYLKHKAVVGSQQRISFDVDWTIRADYLQRANKGGDFILYTDFSKKINNYTVFLKVENLFNHGYSEKGNIPMPGRWIFAGVSATW